ncbi:fimbrial protein [Bacteroides pyogenes]|uniref:Major fimbrial subunit protein N-terminal domain-containing protein n=1 Tax=Bacteroides pyogenes TaxID=310300 RepID=A0A5D3EAQ6_9BACE|nr:fimbrial protein [Bacteroides pyogenes]MBR8708828.1 Major fimbrium subunit FimA type-1 [Bacteroides pyogenes]MBR8717619.1 Major fimbrium subunit FimA type-1 [Bacteroides pyogenes]MBR8747128.1 Major fimbrium subunit FimA type-1 [Bacteroides pyogenes]MBR8757472.1 Major fimbrium subunit FimA type-1 [Bacteroides pyogenes]MBR8780726.1 Major fimbrium subunit FimA type-1 [Bacteroides pyogenes]
MKLEKLFLLGAIAFGLAACSNEDTPVVQQAKNATMSLKIVQGGTRAIGIPDDITAGESKIKRLDVFVFNGDAVDGHKQATGEDVTEVKDIAVTTGSRTMVVVANATADMGTITSKAALLGKVASDLAAQTLENGLLMTSEVTEEFTIQAGKNYYGYAAGQTPAGNEISVGVPVKLTRVPARVALVNAVTQFTGSYAEFTFEPEEIFLFNAKKQSKYFGNPGALVAGTELLSGVDLSSFGGPLKPAAWETADYLKDPFESLDILSEQRVYYYVFENDASVQPTVLSIKGKIKKSSADDDYATATEFPGAIDSQGYTYYSIVVNANKEGYTYEGDTPKDSKILRNTQYNISVTIKHLGKDDPTDPPTEAATLDVKVEVAEWEVVGQNVVY